MDIPDKTTGDIYAGSEFTEFKNEIQNAIVSTAQSLAANSIQLSKAITTAGQTAHSYQDSGIVNAYSLTRTGLLGQPLSYIDGMRVTFTTANSNSAASTVNISTLGVKNIVLSDESSLISGEIIANQSVELIYSSSALSAVGAFILTPWSIQPKIIRNQTGFDAVFDGSVLTNRSIFLKKEGSPYLLNSLVPYNSNLIIDSDPGVVIQRNGQYIFVSQGIVSSYTEGVDFTPNWTFDGQGGIDVALGGSITYAGAGGFNDINYTRNCKFHCIVRNCYATGNGGAYYDSAQLSYSNSIKNIIYCRSNAAGGGCYGIGASLTESTNHARTTIKDVSICQSGTNGGGISSCSFCDIENVYDNVAGASGGGLYNINFCNIKQVFRNSSTGEGGGINLCTNLIVEEVWSNSSSSNGGGLANVSSSTITKVKSNSASVGNGGGLYACNNNTITDVRSNISVNGGGLYNCNNCDITKVNNNDVTADGGGLALCTNAKVSNVYLNEAVDGAGLYNCDNGTISNVYDNTASTGNGGGLSNCDNGTITNVYSNEATLGNGGGLYDCDNSTISTVHDNTAAISGGGLYNCDICTISNVYSNVATTQDGGGLWMCENSVISNVNGNSARNGGGCFDCDNSTMTNIWNNTATVDGGGIYGSANSAISNVYENEATVDGGGVHSSANSTISSVYDNEATADGGGVHTCHTSSLIDIHDNTAGGNGGGAMTSSNCFFSGNWAGNTALTNNYIHSCISALSMCLGSGGTEQINITRATINWD